MRKLLLSLGLSCLTTVAFATSSSTQPLAASQVSIKAAHIKLTNPQMNSAEVF